MHPAVFLDRDGVIIEDKNDYIKSWQEVSFLPGIFEAMQRLSQSGYAVVLITNQSAIGRGIITLQQAMEINQRVIKEIETRGGRVDASFICPHHPDQGCGCRKPAPGMLIRATEELELDLMHSYAIGDALCDIEAASAVGVRSILVLTGRGRDQRVLIGNDINCLVVTDLKAAVDFILGKRETMP